MELLLSRHSEIEGLGELPEIANIARSIPNYPTGHPDLGEDALSQYAEQYLTVSQQFATTSKPHKINKMPTNYFSIGLALFPKAPILHIARDPMATAWTNYRRN